MRSDRKKQIMTLSILIVAVLAISIGFAAFSSTLKINSGATVTTNPLDFKVVFSSSETALETGAIKASPSDMGEDATINNTAAPTISGLVAKTRIPGDSVTYTFYVRNEGKFEAFLNRITFRGKNCIAEAGTNGVMVNNACDAMTTTVSVGSITTNETKTDITGESLKPGESKQVTVTLSYDKDGARANGPFRVEFGDISMHYATANGINEEAPLIAFIVDTTTYQAREGMTWADWISSEYNTGYFKTEVCDIEVCTSGYSVATEDNWYVCLDSCPMDVQTVIKNNDYYFLD